MFLTYKLFKTSIVIQELVRLCAFALREVLIYFNLDCISLIVTVHQLLTTQTTALNQLIKRIPWNAGSGASSLCSFAHNDTFSSLFDPIQDPFVRGEKNLSALRAYCRVTCLGVLYSSFHFPLVLWPEVFSFLDENIPLFSTNLLQI